jgi:hypothetical protein
MMFAFGSQSENGPFTFVQDKDHVYTWPDEKTARSYFETAKRITHLYQIDPDLSEARLLQAGNTHLGAPPIVELTEKQKIALYESFVYKSLLAWVPIPETVIA